MFGRTHGEEGVCIPTLDWGGGRGRVPFRLKKAKGQLLRVIDVQTCHIMIGRADQNLVPSFRCGPLEPSILCVEPLSPPPPPGRGRLETDVEDGLSER